MIACHMWSILDSRTVAIAHSLAAWSSALVVITDCVMLVKFNFLYLSLNRQVLCLAFVLVWPNY